MVVGIVLEGEAAVAERHRLLADGREIPVALRERDARGKMRTLWLKFGMNSRTAWVHCRDEREGMEPQTILEASLAHEATDLFESYVERMVLRQCLVDPSPLSPSFVDIQPSIEEVVQGLEAEFGIKVSPS